MPFGFSRPLLLIRQVSKYQGKKRQFWTIKANRKQEKLEQWVFFLVAK